MSDLKGYDYEALKNLAGSDGWKIIKQWLQDEIDSLQLVLNTPTNDDMFGKISEMDAIKQLNFLNYKKLELTLNKKLQLLPEKLLATKIK